MKIFNLTLRKSLGMGKKFVADDGAGTGGDNPPTDTPPTDTPPIDDGKEEEKTTHILLDKFHLVEI